MALGWSSGMKRQEKAAREARSHAERGRRGQAEWDDNERPVEPLDPNLVSGEADDVLTAARQASLRTGLTAGGVGLASVLVHWLVPTPWPGLWALALVFSVHPFLSAHHLRGMNVTAEQAGERSPSGPTSMTVLLGLVALGLLGFAGHGVVFALQG